LTRCGFDIYCIAYFTYGQLNAHTNPHALLMARLSAFSVRDLWVAASPWSVERRLPEASFTEVRHRCELASIQPQFEGEIPFDRVKVVWTNYASAWPLAERVLRHCADDVLSVVEMHDLCALATRDDRLRAIELEHELHHLRRFDLCLSVSESEAAIVREGSDQETAVEVVCPYSQVRPPQVEDLAGCCDVAEILHACDSSAWIVNYNHAWPKGLLDQVLRLHQETGVDLLFVASDTEANAASLHWFLDECYPQLEGEPNVIIAGSLINRLGDYGHPRIFWAGQVETLAPLYAAAKVIIAPVVFGTGVKIKVIESLSLGKPFVATRESLRGLSDDLQGLGVDTPAEFAARVNMLLSDRSGRERVGADCLRHAEDTSNHAAYLRTITNAFNARGRHQFPDVADSVMARAPHPYVEYNDALKKLNVLCSVLPTSTLAEAAQKIDLSPRALSEAFLAADEETLRRLYDALYASRTAPLTRSNFDRCELGSRFSDADAFLAELRSLLSPSVAAA
jgi:glycosyltransferase involved in cell wall biosynthesis